MNYELAKKLKDAGFPQNNHYYCLEDGTISDVCIPTLSELIEACGKDFETLSWYEYPDKWMVTGGKEEIEEFIASSPEEAVAELYLEISKQSLHLPL